MSDTIRLHIHRVPTEKVRDEPHDDPRWCFVCRKRVSFRFEVHAPIDPMSYYGPHAVVRCEHGHADGDCFPGTWREWDNA